MADNKKDRPAKGPDKKANRRGAARLAAIRRTEEEVKELACLLEKRGDAPAKEDFAIFAERDFAFHFGIVRAAHNEVVATFHGEKSRTPRCMQSRTLGRVQRTRYGRLGGLLDADDGGIVGRRRTAGQQWKPGELIGNDAALHGPQFRRHARGR